MGVHELREEVVAVLDLAARLPCACRRGPGCVPCRAAAVLREILRSGLRIKRWRNEGPATFWGIAHVAGIVWTSREYRRSCPGYMVDRRQACVDCGWQLARGTWDRFWAPGATVYTAWDPRAAQRVPALFGDDEDPVYGAATSVHAKPAELVEVDRCGLYGRLMSCQDPDAPEQM